MSPSLTKWWCTQCVRSLHGLSHKDWQLEQTSTHQITTNIVDLGPNKNLTDWFTFSHSLMYFYRNFMEHGQLGNPMSELTLIPRRSYCIFNSHKITMNLGSVLSLLNLRSCKKSFS